MKIPGIEWKIITRRYLGDTWVQNEMGALNTIIKQQKKLPISVEDARAQVKRLKEQSQSAVKKVNVAYYSPKKDVVDNLTAEQLNELDRALMEADKKETISWDDFKEEMNEWRKK